MMFVVRISVFISVFLSFLAVTFLNINLFVFMMFLVIGLIVDLFDNQPNQQPSGAYKGFRLVTRLILSAMIIVTFFFVEIFNKSNTYLVVVLLIAWGFGFIFRSFYFKRDSK